MEKFRDTSCSAQERAEDLVDRLTVAEQAAQLIYDAPAIERLDIPAYNWWNEGLHGDARAGTATMFPQAIALWPVLFKMCAVSAVVVLLPFVPVIAIIFLSFLSARC